jgi:hypothetical protein
MAGQDPDDYDDDEQSPQPAPWYNRTPAVLGASMAGLALIGILIAAVTFVARQFDEPEQAPLNFVEPSFTATATQSSSAPTTTATITSTSPPVTIDINPPSSTPSSSDTSSSSSGTSSSSDASSPTRVTQSRRSNDESTPRTTRQGPRTNVTRTLYPQP